jgi:endonuclease/exonuclease/phosphatase family metal-dependent hydrolase
VRRLQPPAGCRPLSRPAGAVRRRHAGVGRCGLFDREQWDEGPHCRDYFFVTPDLAARTVDLVVDLETDASDHQPLLLVLRD